MSTMVTVNDPADSLPAASRAVQSTFAGGPTSKTEPEAGEQLRAGDGSRLSVAEKLTTVPNGDAASLVWLPGSTGGVKSTFHDQCADKLKSSPATARTEKS